MQESQASEENVEAKDLHRVAHEEAMHTTWARPAAVSALVTALCLFGVSRGTSETDQRCPAGKLLEPSDTLLGYVGNIRKTNRVVVGPFRPLAILRGKKLSHTDGAFIRNEMKFWPVLAADSAPVELKKASSFVDRVGQDHCVFHADLEGATPPLWTLLSSKPLPGTIVEPTAADRTEFGSLKTECVIQGDNDPGEEPPCVRPKLLAVSDLDEDDRAEYWSTQPYLWDTGITVWERDREGNFVVLLSVCSGCSD